MSLTQVRPTKSSIAPICVALDITLDIDTLFSLSLNLSRYHLVGIRSLERVFLEQPAANKTADSKDGHEGGSGAATVSSTATSDKRTHENPGMYLGASVFGHKKTP